MIAEIPTSPQVQLLGDAVVIRGAAALDIYRVLAEGIAAIRRRDGIEPPPRLLTTVAVCKAAAQLAVDVRADIADVRDEPDSASLRSGELVGTEEVARMFGVGSRQARRLAPSLGGHKKRSGGWVFDLGLVKAYIESEKQA